jgi:hypothetical protein
MNQSIPYFQSNVSYNPLFAKMRERFCADGTIAEKMAAEAGLCKKHSRRTGANEYHMTHGNSLPKRHHVAKKSTLGSFFSLKRLGILSVSMLIAGTVFFSGATFEGIRQGFAETAQQREIGAGEEETLTYDLPLDFGTKLGFTCECAELSL